MNTSNVSFESFERNLVMNSDNRNLFGHVCSIKHSVQRILEVDYPFINLKGQLLVIHTALIFSVLWIMQYLEFYVLLDCSTFGEGSTGNFYAVDKLFLSLGI